MERSSRLVVVGSWALLDKACAQCCAGTRQSIQPKRSESNVDGRPELRPWERGLSGPGTARGGGGRGEQVGVGVANVTPYRVIGRGHLPSTRLGSCGTRDPAPLLPFRNGCWGQSSPMVGTSLPVFRSTPARDPYSKAPVSNLPSDTGLAKFYRVRCCPTSSQPPITTRGVDEDSVVS